MKLWVTLILPALFVETAMAKAPETVSVSIKKIVAAANECAGNGASVVTTFDPDTFDVNAAFAKLQAEDNNRGCAGDRNYAATKADAVSQFFSRDRREIQIRDCMEEYISRAMQRAIDNLVKDPNNLAVFASEVVQNPKNAEGCYYFSYIVYTQKGYAVTLTFDYTD